jgi:hypothetical protein
MSGYTRVKGQLSIGERCAGAGQAAASAGMSVAVGEIAPGVHCVSRESNGPALSVPAVGKRQRRAVAPPAATEVNENVVVMGAAGASG